MSDPAMRTVGRVHGGVAASAARLATVVKRANMSVLPTAEKRMNWGFEGVPLTV